MAHSPAETVSPPEERIKEPLFPLEWSDRIDDFFAAATLEVVPGVGRFTPLEAPGAVAAAVRSVLAHRAP